MAIEAALAEELARFQNSDYRFLALLGYDSELDPARLNKKNRICHVSLLEDMLILFNVQDRFARPEPGEKSFGIELIFGWLSHRSLPWLR
jgi:hypothetical protein